MRPLYLLDTCIVSESSKPRPDQNVMIQLNAKSHLSVISAVTWSELLYGLNIMPEGQRKRDLDRYLYHHVQVLYQQLPFDEHAASVLADLRARCRKSGKVVENADLMIASIAIANNVILVTRNTRHFEPLQEFSPLMLDNWWEDPAA